MPMSAEAKERLRQKSAPYKDAISGGGKGKFQDRSHYVSLSGQNAIVQPGGSVIVRLLPRWDVKSMYKFDPKTKKMVLDPNYQAESEEIAFHCLEHWYEDPSNKTQRDWCRKNLGEEEPCPLDELSEALYASGKENDKSYASRIAVKDVFLYNVIVRKQYDPETKKWVDKQFTDEGKPAIKVLPVGRTIYVKINEIMAGGPGGDEFAYGEIFDISGDEGRDVQIFRPASQGSQYDAKAAPRTSRLYEMGDKRWVGWMDLLHNLPEEVSAANIRSYEAIYRTLHGRAPSTTPSRETEAPPENEVGPYDEIPGSEETGDPSGAFDPELGAESPETPPDFDMPGEEPAVPPARNTRPAPAPSRPAPSRTVPPRRGR